MLKKLMKYEWKNLSKQLLIMVAILFGTTLIASLVIVSINPNFDNVTTGLMTMSAVFAFLLYYLGIIVCTIGTMLIIAIRFYKTCYTDEGYLTHTLPVSTGQLLSAKIIVSTLAYIGMMILIAVSVVSVVIVGLVHVASFADASWEITTDTALTWQSLWNEINAEFAEDFGISLVGYALTLLGICLIGCICGIIDIFGCISLGQLYTKHRIIGAILAYFILNFVTQIISYIGAIPTYLNLALANEAENEIKMFELISPSLIFSTILSIVIAVIMLFVTRYMMTKKLNLE